MTLKFRTDIKKERSTILEIKGKNRNYLSLFFPEKDLLMKNLASKTDKWIKKYLRPPKLQAMKEWTLQILPNIKWSKVKEIVRRFRNSLPIVSSKVPDGRATSTRSGSLPRAFRHIAWVASDLGNLLFLCIFPQVFFG